MPRQLRIDYPGAIHHVMSRGDRRENIYPASVVTNGESGVSLSAALAGDSSGLVNVNGASLTSPVLSSGVGIGTGYLQAPLDVFSTDILTALFDGSSPIGTWTDFRNTSAGGMSWMMISTGSGNGEGPGKLAFNWGPAPNTAVGNALTLQPNGYVGVDTATPAYNLDVYGDIGLEGTPIIYNSANAVIDWGGGTLFFRSDTTQGNFNNSLMQ